MKKRYIILVLGGLCSIFLFAGYILKIGHLAETGWESSSFPFWMPMIAFGVCYCGLLWFKHLHFRAHPFIWLVGIAPMAGGLYIGYMMGAI